MLSVRSLVWLNISVSPPLLRDWVIKDLGVYSRVYATGHIKDPVPLIEKRRGLSPGGRFPPSFIQSACRTHSGNTCIVPYRFCFAPYEPFDPDNILKYRENDDKIFAYSVSTSIHGPKIEGKPICFFLIKSKFH